ncbi:Subtilisin-like protease SBT1.8 [Rhynchospora pubera]|uniref:Subtilisin-like protease SBT1.8 n=1 Tax=Rhynchospora pubera TaxID=906938 RepID=A0AAV8FLR7_9POAL|nr:Subtilisin-like protease SBT1.8 [Rhynchospora pubera]
MLLQEKVMLPRKLSSSLEYTLFFLDQSLLLSSTSVFLISLDWMSPVSLSISVKRTVPVCLVIPPDWMPMEGLEIHALFFYKYTSFFSSNNQNLPPMAPMARKLTSTHQLTTLLSLLLLQLTTSLTAQPSSYIIHTQASARPAHYATQDEWYESIVRSLPPRNATTKPHIFHTYKFVLQGFAATLTPEEARLISESQGVIAVDRDSMSSFVQTTHSPDFLGLNTDYGIWQESNLGSDVIIGVLDTGIWPESPSFNDCGLTPVGPSWRGECEAGTRFDSSMCNNKLIGARFIHQGATAMGYQTSAIHDLSPRDNVGHGTHASSIAAGSPVLGASLFGKANGTARGMAPKARIAMYKVCWRENCTDSDITKGISHLHDISAGVDKAIEDGVHILSISLGGDRRPYYDDPIVRGALKASRHGIFVTCSAGNDGPRLFTVGNTAPWITTVAAGSIDRTFSVDGQTTIGKKRAPQVASYSSRGPNLESPELLKPDILAPGGNILAAWPSEIPVSEKSRDPRPSDFNILSGTSMACPHVAGIAALLWHLHPTWSPAMIRSAMMTTASVHDNRDRNIGSTPLAFGAGHVHPQAANDPGLVYDVGFEDYLVWLCRLNYTTEQVSRFVAETPLNCNDVHSDTDWDLNYPSFGIVFKNCSDVVVKQRYLTKVTGRDSEQYTARVLNLAPERVSVTVQPEILEFGRPYEKKGYTVQFQNKVCAARDRLEFGFAYIIWENDEHQVKSPAVFIWNGFPVFK